MSGIRVNIIMNWRLTLIHAGILATFGLIPVWYRFSTAAPPPLFLPKLYVSYFLIFLPMLWTICWWVGLGLPGVAGLRRDTLRAGWALALLLLALWALASPLWAFQRDAYPEVAAGASLQFGVVALFSVVVACAGPPRQGIVGIIVVGVLWNSIVTIGQVAAQGPLDLRALGEFPLDVNSPGISYVQAGPARWLRPYSLLPHPNMLAGYFAIGLLAILVWIAAHQRLLRWAGFLIFTLGWWSFLLTFSRGAWIGLAAGGFAMLPALLRKRTPASQAIWLMEKPRLLKGLLLSLGIALAVGLIFAAAFRPFLSARAGIGGESIEQRSVSDRMVFADFAYRSILERPILGVGAGNFPWRASYYLMNTDYDLRGDNVHHAMLSAWAELGLVGFLLLASALVLGVEAALRDLRRKPVDVHGRGEPVFRAADDAFARLACLGGFMTLTAISLLDHYPWTILHFQVAWWGLLAAALRPNDGSPQADPPTA